MPDEGGDSWKIVMPCSRAVAEAVSVDMDVLIDFPLPPVLLAREPDPRQPEDWLIEVYFESEPDEATVEAVRSLVPGLRRADMSMDHVPEADWVALSQEGLEPVNAGRFHVHTSAAGGEAPPAGAISFLIDAGLAFGTGQHETTVGCLETLDRMHRGGLRFRQVADVGTGTGLLAFAALRLWPLAGVIASDIDPISIAVARENAQRNGIGEGTRPGTIELVVAAGLAHRRLRRRAPFDLIVANILAGPLIDLAPILAGALAPGGHLILAGLLDRQADAVLNAHRKRGMRSAGKIRHGDWPTLHLVKRMNHRSS